MQLLSKELKDYALNLRISGILATLEERISYANAKKLSYEEFLELILSDEFERREARSLNMKLKRAGVTSLYTYDWNTTTQYDRQLVKKLFNLSFVEKHSSILIFGPTGPAGWGLALLRVTTEKYIWGIHLTPPKSIPYYL